MHSRPVEQLQVGDMFIDWVGTKSKQVEVRDLDKQRCRNHVHVNGTCYDRGYLVETDR